jgi:hypothetical protein
MKNGIKETLTNAKITRNKFFKYWESKGHTIDKLKLFLEYPIELQLGVMIEFLSLQNIGLIGYKDSFDLYVIREELLPEKDRELISNKSHFVYEMRDDIVFINDNKKHKHIGVKTIMDGYMIAICTAINWINYDTR